MKQIPRKIKHKYPGSWLYSKRILEWLYIPELRAQLPFLFRLFSRYAEIYFRITENDYLRGGRRIFLFLKTLNKTFLKEFTTIQLPEHLVCVDLTDPRFLNVINEMLKEKSDTSLLQKLLGKGDTFIDVGANHGSFSIIASRIVDMDGLIIAIEPQPRLAYTINQSLKLNATCNYNVHQTAVGEFNGEITFLIPNDTSGTAGIYPGHSGKHSHKKLTVPINKFDDLVDLHKLPGKILIKVDIEGGEYSFLQGAKNSLKIFTPILLMEINPNSLQTSGTQIEDLIGILEDLGFRWYAEVQDPNLKVELNNLSGEWFRNVIFYKT